MSGFVKLFSDIVDSSIWDEDSDTCKVWVTLLALADQDGFVRGSDGWLAGKSRVSIEKCASALASFQAPDVRSRTADYDGRRIDRLEDGWLILNYIKFRNRLSTNPQAVATRERVRKHRERYNALRNRKSVTPAASASASASVSEGECEGKPTTHRFEKPTVEAVKLAGAKAGLPESECEKFFSYYESNGWRVGKNPMKSWPAALANWQRNWKERTYEQPNRGTQTCRPNPRNDGITVGPTDYGKATPRLQRQREAAAKEAAMAQQVAANGDHSPEGVGHARKGGDTLL